MAGADAGWAPPIGDGHLATDEHRLEGVHLLARSLAGGLDDLVADARAGRVDIPLTAYPALMAGYALETLTRPMSADEAADAQLARVRQVVRGLRGAADVLEDLATPRLTVPAEREGHRVAVRRVR